MVIQAKYVALSVSTIGMVSLLSGLAVHYRPRRSVDDVTELAEPASGAIPGRIVQIPGKEYRESFKVEGPKLGQCALKMAETRIKTCSDKFGGEEVFIPRGSTEFAVAKVQTSEDILSHIMGGFGASVGVLGLASVSVKYNVAVTTETSSKSLNLMSSYSIQRGTRTLQNPYPLTSIGREGTLFLSEIELGGNEALIVTMNFESEKKKIEVSVTVKVKILFISITAKLKFIHETFKTASSVRIQFVSSFREKIDKTFTSLADAVKEVERIEQLYLSGPEILNQLDVNDERLHNFYYFSAWNKGPYGDNLNLGVINNDLDVLKQQSTEANSVISFINELSRKPWPSETRSKMDDLKRTLTAIISSLDKGMNSYHSMSDAEKTELRKIYGEEHPPFFYQRKLKRIIGY